MRVVNHDPPDPTLFAANFISAALGCTVCSICSCSLGAFTSHLLREAPCDAGASSYTTSLAGNRNVRVRDSPLRFLLVGDAASGTSTCYTFELWSSPYFPSRPKYLLESSRQQGEQTDRRGTARGSKQFDSGLENVGRA